MRKDTSVEPYKMTQLQNFKNDPFGYVVMGYYSPKHLQKQKEYAEKSVRQPNELTRGFYKCSSTAQKLFVVTVAEFLKQNKTKKDREVSLELSDIIYGLNINDGSKTRTLFKESVNEVGDLNIIMQDDEHGYYRINLFEEVKYNWDWGTLKFKLSEKFSEFLEIEHKTGFTIFSLEITGKLQSFYAIRYYEIAMSYYGFKGGCKDISSWAKENGVDKKNSWFFAYSLEQLRTLFRIEEDKYLDSRNFKRKVIQLPIDEINSKISTLSIKVETVYEKKKIQGFIFWCSEIKIDKKVHQIGESTEDRLKTNEINKNKEDLAICKTKYPEEFNEILEKIKKSHKAGELSFPIFDEFEAVKILKEKYKF